MQEHKRNVHQQKGEKSGAAQNDGFAAKNLMLPLSDSTAWWIDPLGSFNVWLDAQRNPRFRSTSKRVYRALWSKFVKWLSENKIEFLNVKTRHFTEFLESLQGVNRPQRERYQLLIKRAFESLTVQDPSFKNPYKEEAVQDLFRKSWRAAQENAPKEFITIEDQRSLQLSLISTSMTQRMSIGSSITPTQWKSVRDTALVALLLTSGVKLSEAIYLSVNCIFVKDKQAYIDTSQYHGLTAAEAALMTRDDPHQDAVHAFKGEDRGSNRRVPIPDWSAEILTFWVEVLTREGTQRAGTQFISRLFPGARKLSSARPVSLMHPVTIQRCVGAWGKAHTPGIVLTPQRLRNTFGAALIEGGTPLPEVERLMGYVPLTAGAFKLSAAWKSFCERAQALNQDGKPGSRAGNKAT